MSASFARTLQRRTFRRSVLLPCQVVRERDFRLVSSLALDLSTEGVLVLTGERVLTGENLLISFQAPRGQVGWFDLEARVARVVHGRRPGDLGRCLGLSFDVIGEADKLRLFEGIRGLPAASAHRPS